VVEELDRRLKVVPIKTGQRDRFLHNCPRERAKFPIFRDCRHKPLFAAARGVGRFRGRRGRPRLLE
jgi:hypothetical protein